MFSDVQMNFLNSIGLKFNYANLLDDDYIIIEEVIGDKLAISGFDKDYKINEIGVICESILDELSKQ